MTPQQQTHPHIELSMQKFVLELFVIHMAKKKKMKFYPYLTAYTKSFTQGRDTSFKEDTKIINHKIFKIFF